MSKAVMVTGGNDGIGFALCKQLVIDHGCMVFLGARNVEKGAAAVESIKNEMPCDSVGSVQMVQVDVGVDESVVACAEAVKQALGGTLLYGLVNNAGIGLQAKAEPPEIINTNLYGPKRMVEQFMPLLDPSVGRIVNIGSGGGPLYCKRCPLEAKKKVCSTPDSWADIEEMIKPENSGVGSEFDVSGGYGVSKAMLTCYSMLLAKHFPNLMVSCCTPGFIDTKLVAGWGASKPPEQGTVAIKHCLFNELQGNGWFYGSDAKRSPLHYMRDPGTPEWDGKWPFSSALIASTSASKMGEHDTGAWSEEICGPYYVFKDGLCDVTVCSISGGDIPIDAGSLSETFKTENDKKMIDEGSGPLKGTKKLADCDVTAFDIVFFAGGHGTCVDFPTDAVGEVVSQALAAGKVVAAVCHGPMALVNAKVGGDPLVKGKKVACFTDVEEGQVGLTEKVPFLLESKMKELGATVEAADAWSDKVVQDGKLVTGQNPQSSVSCAKLALAAV